MKALIIAIVLCLTCSTGKATDIVGVPRIVDGDTLAIGPAKIRLVGIDAPESDQLCINPKGLIWTCGIEARDRLTEFVGSREVKCISQGIDVYRRTLAVCAVEGRELNAWMVREGWALAYVKYSSAYINEEEQARALQRGLWVGAFIAPWDWRHRTKQTVVLGALAVPTTAQNTLVNPSLVATPPSADCIIKGNVNRNGEHIYHLPHQQFYGRINMNIGDGKRWFCSAEEAELAGWRRALR